MTKKTTYNPAEYGDTCAAFYDELYPTIEGGMLSTLSGLARGGPVLELGLGTGRVARRLNEAGVIVHGIEASAAMVMRCRSLPGSSGLRIVVGDFASRLGTSPQVFDQIAMSAGLCLFEAWADWHRTAVTETSARRILVYRTRVDSDRQND